MKTAVDDQIPAFVAEVSKLDGEWRVALEAAKPERIEALVSEYREAQYAEHGDVPVEQLNNFRRGLSNKRLAKLEETRKTYEEGHRAALETIATAEAASEELQAIDCTPEWRDVADRERFAAAEHESRGMHLVTQLLDGGTLTDVAHAYERANKRGDRAAMRLIELANQHGWRMLHLQADPDGDATAILKFQSLLKAAREARHPAWTKEARKQLKRSVGPDAILKLVKNNAI